MGPVELTAGRRDGRRIGPLWLRELVMTVLLFASVAAALLLGFVPEARRPVPVRVRARRR
jgi:hypothetical protein